MVQFAAKGNLSSDPYWNKARLTGRNRATRPPSLESVVSLQNCAANTVCSLDESEDYDSNDVAAAAFNICRLSTPHFFHNLVSIKRSESTPNSSSSDAMVSKLNESTERVTASDGRDSEVATFDISGQSPSETEKAITTRNVLWQPKMSGSVKNRIRNIEAHAQSSEQQQHLQEGVLSKSVLHDSEDLCYHQSVPKWKSAPSNCDPLLQQQQQQLPIKEVGGHSQEKLTRGGTWCSAVVSKPYPVRPLAANLSRSKTLPSVYQVVTKNESAYSMNSSSSDRSNLADDMPPLPPPWLQDLKRRSIQQSKPPWWSRAYSIDEGRLGSLPPSLVPKPNEPSSGKTSPVRTNSPLVEKKVLPSNESLSSSPKPPSSPVNLRKTPSSLSPVSKRKTTNGHVQEPFINSNEASFNQKALQPETAGLKSLSTNTEKGSSSTWSFQLENVRHKYAFVNKGNYD